MIHITESNIETRKSGRVGIAVSHSHNSHCKVDRSKNWVAGAKTAVKKTIPSFYAAITHQDTGTFNQHQHSRDDSQLICPRIKYYSLCCSVRPQSWPGRVNVLSPYISICPFSPRRSSGPWAQGGEWRSEMERDFEICFIGREGCLSQRAQDGLDPGNAQL